MLRRRSNTLLATSIALLAAAVLGVQLGQSAIGEINPIHFRGELAGPRGIDPAAVIPPPNQFASAYGWDQGHAARARDCGGDCDARRARDAFALVLAEPPPARRADAPYWRDATPTAEPAPWTPGETAGRPLSIEPYLHYPVEADAGIEVDDAKPPFDEAESGADD